MDPIPVPILQIRKFEAQGGYWHESIRLVNRGDWNLGRFYKSPCTGFLIETQCTEVQCTDLEIRKQIQHAVDLQRLWGPDFRVQLRSKIFGSAVRIRLLVFVRPRAACAVMCLAPIPLLTVLVCTILDLTPPVVWWFM